MADFNPVFEIDSGALLAKLHLAGAQQAPNAVIVNSGIENPPDKPDPANLGKTKFVLDSKSGSYQVAAISWMAFFPKIVPEKIEELAKLEKQLAEVYKKAGKSLEADSEEDEKNEKKPGSKPDEKDNGDEKKEAAHAKDSLTAKTKDEDDKQPKKESLQTKKSLMKLLFEDDAEDEEEEKSDPEVEKAEKACYDFYNDFQAKMQKKPKLDEDDFLASRKSFYEAVEETNKLRAGDSEEAKLQLKKTAAKELKTYFETFAGKENVKSLDEKSMAIYLVGVGDGQAKVSDFAGMVSDDRSAISVQDKSEEVQEAIGKAQSDAKTANEEIRCYAAVVAGFSIDLD